MWLADHWSISLTVSPASPSLIRQGKEPSSPNLKIPQRGLYRLYTRARRFSLMSQRRGAWHLCRPWLRGWEDGGSPDFSGRKHSAKSEASLRRLGVLEHRILHPLVGYAKMRGGHDMPHTVQVQVYLECPGVGRALGVELSATRCRRAREAWEAWVSFSPWFLVGTGGMDPL